MFKISGDQFYKLLSGKEDALFQLYKKLPKAVDEFLESIGATKQMEENSAFAEIKEEADKSKRNILNQITFENYSYYLGFDNL